ncbi:3625_t:CDS:2, partial [Dentiscutata heterogama]
ATYKIPTYNVHKCGGSLDISSYEIYVSQNDKITFLLEIKDSVNLDGVNVQPFVNVWENDVFYVKSTCSGSSPTNNGCMIYRTQPTIIINSTYTITESLYLFADDLGEFAANSS